MSLKIDISAQKPFNLGQTQKEIEKDIEFLEELCQELSIIFQESNIENYEFIFHVPYNFEVHFWAKFYSVNDRHQLGLLFDDYGYLYKESKSDKRTKFKEKALLNLKQMLKNLKSSTSWWKFKMI